MKKIFCVILCLVFVLALFVMPSSAAEENLEYGKSSIGYANGYFFPLDFFDFSYQQYRTVTGYQPVVNMAPVTYETISDLPGEMYYVFPTASSRKALPPTAQAVLQPYVLPQGPLSFMDGFHFEGNSLLRAFSTSNLVASLGQRIDFEMPLFVERSGLTNDLVTVKSLYFRFRPYDGKRFFTNSNYGEILAWTNIVYNGVVSSGPDYAKDLFRGDNTIYPKCNYDYYTIQVSFDYHYGRFQGTNYVDAPPDYALYSCEVDFRWNAPSTSSFFTSIVLGSLSYSRFKNGYAVDNDGNMVAPSLDDALAEMKSQIDKSFEQISFSGQWANSLLSYLNGPIKFFNGFANSFFGFGHFPTLANLAYGLIFISVGSMLFGFAADIIPSIVSKGKSKVSNAERSYREAYGRRKRQAEKNREDIRKHLK